ncbi:MAG: leucine--tRNA ligase [Armatimonadetes bacterium 55-13]|nr:leucine--tRNA ligase [Armatimonadota bacterium]OJU64778.1 MAG: leucine--tRNA ligase [Armatimonadetes bacterium 55-13]
MADRYDPSSFESKWQERWKDADLFVTREVPGRPKFYGMDFFPYPSGAGLSVGHCRNYVPTDVLCRMKVMQGYNVLHPMGFDAFGLPAENEAIKQKSHPAPMIEKYAANYRRQMDLVGISYDWSRSFASSDPDYYKWTQWIFEILHKRGLAYRRLAAVNWDPVDKTVLADEEIIGGRAERSNAIVEKKWIPQWFFKITEYAERLLNDLDELDWPEGIKAQQRNWIGKSEGVQFRMQVAFISDEEFKKAWGGQAVSTTPETRDELKELVAEIEASGFKPEVDSLTAAKAANLVANAEKAAFDANRPIESESVTHAFESASVKAGLEFVPKERSLSFEVFTTRIDTVFGMTFCVLAPEHEIVDKIRGSVSPEFKAKIDEYREQAKLLSDTARTATDREKTGVFTGAYAVNPANGKPVPIWIADYVLAGYGTGAIMAVPGHDQRDFDFAVKFGINVIPVIKPTQEYLSAFFEDGGKGYDEMLAAYQSDVTRFNPVFESKDSTLINSGEYTGMSVQEAQASLGRWVEALDIGTRKTQFKLRDWLISRQRYWGCPIPVIHTKDGEEQLVPEDCLPVLLPDVDNYEPSGDGSSPLAHIPDFVNTTDLDGRLGQRETDTMGGFACSSWYFLRFCDPHNDSKAWNLDQANYWMPVDCYVGGAEHAVMHLLYARFWTKVLFDEGLIKVKEPFARLENQGQVLAHTPYRKPRADERLDVGEDGILVSFKEAESIPEEDLIWRWARMSKSKGNVVTPDEMVREYGADALRIYLLFVAPFNADIEWKNEGVEAAARFLSRVFRFVEEAKPHFVENWADLIAFEELDETAQGIRRATHKTIRDVTKDIDAFGFNTYISWLMKYLNALNDAKCVAKAAENRGVALAVSEAIETIILLLSPAAPHSADELWDNIGKEMFTYQAEWPKFDEALTVESESTIAIQVNGKLRDTVTVPADISEEALTEAAKSTPKISALLNGLTVRKVIVVPSKLVNIVAN